jgi:hypothetical protein
MNRAEEGAQRYAERLQIVQEVAWRAHRLGKSLSKMQKAYSGRFGDITLPLLKIVRLVAPPEEKTLLDLFAGMEKGRLNEKSRTLEGDILTALMDLESEVKNGKLPLKRLVERLNEERGEKEKVTPRFASPRLRSLGFQLTNRNPADIVWNKELLEHCLIAYGIKDPPPPPETSSQSSQSSQGEAEKAEEKQDPDESVENVESVERQNPGGRRGNQSEQEALKGPFESSHGKGEGRDTPSPLDGEAEQAETVEVCRFCGKENCSSCNSMARAIQTRPYLLPSWQRRADPHESQRTCETA